MLIEGPVCKQSLYPQWFSLGHQVRIFDSARENLEFEVSHSDGERLHYIGTAFVDINDIQMRSSTQTTGWFNLVDKRDKRTPNQKPPKMNLTGQIKVAVTVAPNLVQM